MEDFKRDTMQLSMVLAGGVFIVGIIIDGGRKLFNPRIFQIIDDGKTIWMGPPPSTPPFMWINYAPHYPIPKEEKAIYDLFWKVTHPEINAGTSTMLGMVTGGKLN